MSAFLFCVSCKDCGKPFSAGRADEALTNPDLATENRAYKKEGHKVEIVASVGEEWCDCRRK